MTDKTRTQAIQAEAENSVGIVWDSYGQATYHGFTITKCDNTREYYYIAYPTGAKGCFSLNNIRMVLSRIDAVNS